MSGLSGTHETGNAPGEDFIELGLLFFVTGLTVVLIVAIVEFVIVRTSDVESDWVVIAVIGLALSGLAMLAYRLLRRLLWFTARLR